MVPSSDLEMAVNNTYSSIISEIQLSNLNFSIQMTPFASYITLKKSVQKDIDGVQATPTPPLLFLLQEARQQILYLQNENFKIKLNGDILQKKFQDIEIENQELVKSFEEAKETISYFIETKNTLHEKIDVAEKRDASLKHEKAAIEAKLKEIKYKHADELKKLQVQVKHLENEKKASDKENHDLTRNLRNTRDSLKNCKSEKSLLKTCRTKLETKIRNLEQQKITKQVDHGNPLDENSNNTEACTKKRTSMPSLSSHSLIPSMVSHCNPNLTSITSDLSSMVAHCTMLPPPGSLPLSIEEVLEALEKAVQRINASMKWV